MPADWFLDTNVLVYLFDPTQPAKQTRADALIRAALAGGHGWISSQVLQEFLNVATRRFPVPLDTDQAQLTLQHLLLPLCRLYPDRDLYAQALDLRQRWQFAFYDALIIAAALRLGCDTLYSEDFQHRQRVEGLTILNPFLEDTALP